MMRRVLLFLVACSSVVTSGCQPEGPDLAMVRGTVTLDGTPLEGATVMFQPTGGRPSFGTTDREGRYELGYTIERRGAMIGSHRVNIRTQQEDDSGRVIQPERLPARYHDQTTLTAEVTSGTNAVDFNLTSK